MGAQESTTSGSCAAGALGSEAYLLGFGTDHGTVIAASAWDEPHEVKAVRPADPRSYEALCHQSGLQPSSFRSGTRSGRLREELMAVRLERAIGVIYRPETELQSHYFPASLPRQFDEWVWFDETHRPPSAPARGRRRQGLPTTYPFGV